MKWTSEYNSINELFPCTLGALEKICWAQSIRSMCSCLDSFKNFFRCCHVICPLHVFVLVEPTRIFFLSNFSWDKELIVARQPTTMMLIHMFG